MASIVAKVGAAVVAVFALTSCVPYGDPVGQPRGHQFGVVDYAGVLGVAVRNDQMASARIPKGLLKRVLVGPAAVLQSSRPAAAGGSGKPLRGAESIMLFNLLNGWGSDVLAPAMLRPAIRAACPIPCEMTNATWLEQAIWLRSVGPKGGSGLQPPSAALPIAHLHSGLSRVPVHVAWNDGAQQLQLAPRALFADVGLCPDLTLPVPAARFSTEVVDLSTGRVLLRVDRLQTEEGAATTRFKIVMRTPDHRVVGGYRQVFCKTIAQAWADRMLPQFQRPPDKRLQRLRALVAGTLAPLRK